MYIYIATNTVNKKQYVGQSIHHPKTKRIPRHKMALGKYAISNAIRKHGFESFTWEVLYYPYASQDALNSIERDFITNLNTLSPNGYNLDTGGNAGGKYTPEARSKISKGLTGKKLTPETRQKISKALTGEKHPNYGKKISPKQRKKISESMKGNNNSTPPSRKDTKHTPETRTKISLTNKKRILKKRGQLTLFD